MYLAFALCMKFLPFSNFAFSGVYIRPKGDHVDVKTIGHDEESGIG